MGRRATSSFWRFYVQNHGTHLSGTAAPKNRSFTSQIHSSPCCSRSKSGGILSTLEENRKTRQCRLQGFPCFPWWDHESSYFHCRKPATIFEIEIICPSLTSDQGHGVTKSAGVLSIFPPGHEGEGSGRLDHLDFGGWNGWFTAGRFGCQVPTQLRQLRIPVGFRLL